jgi:fimbrial isopeptide formation D2 family protein/uncharacterized repeat protein (TIGR01451 family)
MNLVSLFSRSTQRLRHLGTLACAVFVLLASPGADAAYVQVYNTIQKGALTFTGNTLVLNSATVAGTGGVYVAADLGTAVAPYPVGTTNNYLLNNSRAQLKIPFGATVLYAELIWSGTVGTNTAAAMNGSVKFVTPSGTYSIAPSAATAGVNSTYYTRSANVTGLVQIAGSGTYSTGAVAGMIATAGTTDGAGWTLAVAYADPSKVARNLTIFVGQELSNAAPATVSGFCTPVSGPVNGRAVVSAIEGDTTGTGDRFLFGPTSTLTAAAHSLSGPNNAIGNFFASQINGDTGTLDTSGTFGTTNQIINVGTNAGTNVFQSRQGYDITNVDASAFLTNSQTTASAQGFTASDVYGINGLGLQIDVTSPIFPVTVKQVNKTSTFVGDQLVYTVDLDNRSGNGAATSVNFFDNVPAGTNFVPGSVTIDASPFTTPNPISNPGNPATGIAIGTVAVGSVVRISFKVNVVALPASPAPAKFDNAARWDYTYIACAGVVAQTGSVTTSAISTSSARLEPVKTVSPAGPLVGGQTVTYTIAIPNTGLRNTAGTTLADPIPAGTVYVAGSTKLNGVAVPDGPGSVMPYATAAMINSAGQSAGVIAFGAAATIQFSVAATNAATVLNTATIDPDGGGPGTAITVSAVNSGLNGPSVAKTFAPATIGAGSKATLTVTLTNPNSANAITGASVTDNLPGGMTIANPANASTTCTGGTVTAAPSGTTLALSGGTIPANGSCTLTADVTVATAGSYTNTIPAGAVSSTNAGLNTAGSQTLTVTPAPGVSKSFTPGTVAPNAVSSLSITLSNPTAAALTGVSFSDIFPSTAAGAPGNMTLFNTTVTNSCGGTLTDAAGAALSVGSAGIKLVGGSIGATNVCTITVNVKAPTGGSYGNTIPAGALTTSGGASTAAAAATLQIASPQVSKSFGAATIGASPATTTMTITLTNVTGATITGMALTDTYPVGLVNTNTTVTNTSGCGGSAVASATATNPGTLTWTGGSILAGDSCDIVVNVQSATPGTYTNTIAAGAVTSSIGTNAAGASATLNVARPSITKSFAAPTIPINSTALLTITLINPTATAMTGAAFTDTLPAGLSAATPGGTCTIGTKSAAGGTVSLSGGTIPANSSCTVTAVVTGTSIGLKINTIPVGGLTVTGPTAASNGTAASDDITVLAGPTITKSFLTSPILPTTGVSTLQIVLANSSSVTMTGAAFTDTFPIAPGAMTLADLTTTNSCSGTLVNNLGAALAVGAAGIRLTGGIIPSNGTCTITVNVKASLAGDYTNTIPAGPTAGFLNTTNGGGSTIAATAPLSVRLAAPAVAKSFSPSTIVANAATTMTLTITNPSTTQAITGVAWSDIFPAGMTVFSTPTFTNSCGGTVTAGNVAADTSFALSGATVPFNAGGTASCAITVQVTSSSPVASPGVTNTAGVVTSANANTSATASGNLIVTTPPLTPVTINKVFLQPSISSGGISTIRFTLGSTNTGILNNAKFTDTLGNMSVASATIGGTCTSVTNSPALVLGATGANALNLTVPNIAPGGCTVEIQVTSTNIGVNPNSVSAVTTTQVSGGTGSGPVNLTVVGKPAISKAFAPATIGVGGSSVLTLTISNPTAGALTGLSFTDAYPTNLVNSPSPTATTTCTGGTVTAAANAGSISLAGGTLAANASCTVKVNVSSAVAGSYVNSSGGVSSVETGAAGTGSNTATLSVVGTQLSKAFSPASIGLGGISTLTFTVTNEAGNPLQPGFGFTDTLPAGLTISGIPTIGQCGGSVTSTANSVSLNGGSLALGAASCTVSVNVTSSTSGSYTNNSSNISALTGGLTAAGISANLDVLVAPSIVKNFSPISIAPGAKSTLTIVLSNTSALAVSGAAFTDIFPASAPAGGAMTVAPSFVSTNTCGGSFTDNAGGTLAAGAAGIKLIAGVIPANGSCQITIEVTATRSGTAVTSYLNTIPAGGLTSIGGFNLVGTSSTLSLPLPLISKVFFPTTVGTNTSSALTITLTNNSANPYVGATFTDIFPTAPGQMRLFDAITSNSCSGTLTASTGAALATNSTSIKLASGIIPANGSCTVIVNVKDGTRGVYTNTIPAGGLVTTSAGSNDIAATDVLAVQEPDLQVTKTHTGNFIVGSTGTYTLKANNLLGNLSTANNRSYTIVDTLPDGLTLASVTQGTWSCSTNLPTVPTTITCNNTADTIAAGATNNNAITINVNVLAAAFPSVTNTATISYNAAEDPTNNTVSDLTVVMGPPTVTKSFSPSAITTGQPSTLSISITNPNPIAAITGAAFTDTYPIGMVNTATPAAAIIGSGCSGSVVAANNGTSLTLTGGNIPANSSCTVTVNVTSASANSYLNSTGPVATTNSGTGVTDSATLTVSAKPAIAKSFVPNAVFVGAPSVLTLTITNPNPAPISGAAFTDTYPAGLVNASAPAAAITGAGCAGTVNAAVNGTSLSLSGGSIPANSSCTVTVNVTSALAGSYSNTSGGVRSTETGSAGAASNTAVLTVSTSALLTVTKTAVTPIVVNSATGTTATYTVTVTNSGGTAATGVKLTDSLPPGFSYASTASVSVNGATTTQFSVTNGATPEWDITPTGGFTINPGKTLVVTFTANIVSAVASGPYNNSAAVTSTSPVVSIVNFDGNTSSTDDVLVTSASLTVTKTTSTPTVTNTATGTFATYFVTVTNSGSGTASGVKVIDTLPAGLTYASTTGVTLNGASLTIGNYQVVTSGLQTPNSPQWDTAPAAGFSINPGQSLAITFVANISSAASGGSYSNSAFASSTNASSIINFDGASTSIEDVVVIPAGVAISGVVYSDVNHNASFDGGEVGTGLPIYIKLATSTDGICLSPGLQATAVDMSTSGAYSFSGVVPGEYCLIVSNNNSLTDLTPAAPSGWIFSGFSSGIRLATVVTRAITIQNIGIFHGSKLSGLVFFDTGVGSGIANDGIQNGGEIGIGGVSVKATNGATMLETAITDGSGNYTLWIPSTASGSILITDANNSGYLSTGGTPGTTGGSYTRNSDVTSFNFVSGSIYTGVNFGNVPVNRFVANGQQSGSPGNVLFYPHQFNAGSSGSVSLSVASAGGWPVVMYRDLNCNGAIDAGDTVISAAASLVASEQLCIVNKVTIPAGTALGGQDAATLQAVFTYTNANPALAATLLVIDSTTVGAGSAGLVLAKTTDKATALPGDTINYTVSYQNNSSTPLGTIVISDATPAFTTFVSAECNLPLPTAITQCTFVTSPAPGGGASIQWTLTGSLNPASVGQVVFAVKVNN